MKGFGFTLMILGIGAFILPRFGFQFKFISMFGSHQNTVAIAAIVVGAVLCIANIIATRSTIKDNQTNQQEQEAK